jgi:L,D-transpeptidase ErfK/SrfK
LLALLILTTLLLPAGAVADTFPLPPSDVGLVGEIVVVRALAKDTLLDVARRHDIGQEEIVRANPDVDRWLPGAGTQVTLPSRFILPPGPRRGLVLNAPEMRLYFYPAPAPGLPAEVQTYPVSIGRMGWATPLRETKLVAKELDPAWRPPESIRREHAAEGDPLPAVVPPGPDNPLGRHALRLGIPGYLIHSTNKAFGVGMRVSHGCIRMLPEDIEWLFPQVPVGTPVRIVNQPAKVGWYGDTLYLEMHPPLDEDQAGRDALVENVWEMIREAQVGRFVILNERAIDEAIAGQSGMPVAITEDLF